MKNYHSNIEKSIFILLVLTILVTSIGAIVQIFPLFKKEISIEETGRMRPYTPLELIGFNIYKKEGCYGCHSQQIRRLSYEIERYGHYSLAVESSHDFPFAWGSKRTGPDLARIGEKYSDDWHVEHLNNPRSLVPESIMPRYPHLHKKLNMPNISTQMELMRKLGVQYEQSHIKNAATDIKIQLGMEQNNELIKEFQERYTENTPRRKFNKQNKEITEMDALVAYLQSLGNKLDLTTNKGRSWYD
jgi:cytochrome c oxidase cbb3-type subunit 2